MSSLIRSMHQFYNLRTLSILWHKTKNRTSKHTHWKNFSRPWKTKLNELVSQSNRSQFRYFKLITWGGGGHVEVNHLTKQVKRRTGDITDVILNHSPWLSIKCFHVWPQLLNPSLFISLYFKDSCTTTGRFSIFLYDKMSGFNKAFPFHVIPLVWPPVTCAAYYPGYQPVHAQYDFTPIKPDTLLHIDLMKILYIRVVASCLHKLLLGLWWSTGELVLLNHSITEYSCNLCADTHLSVSDPSALLLFVSQSRNWNNETRPLSSVPPKVSRRRK